MQIKEVEAKTGLTAKSIRYYESKNLIQVERNEGNSYRDYSKEDVNRLKCIKLFRYLDFSIEEIKQLIDENEEQIREKLRQKAEIFSKQRETCESKQEMCLCLAKDYKDNLQFIEEYHNIIEVLESDELEDAKEKIEDFVCPSLTTTIVQTLLFLAPVVWLFYNIKAERTDMLMMNAVFAVIGTAITTWNWIRFVQHYKKDRNRVKKKNREMIWWIPTMIVACIVGIGAYVALVCGWAELLAPDDFLFYEHGPIASYVMIWVIMIPAILVCALLLSKIRRTSVEELENTNDILYTWNHLGKWRFVVIGVWLVVLYGCITSMNVVTSDQIIHYSPIHPLGIIYDYSDVEAVVAGFGEENFSIADYKKKGSFFYQIELDGKEIIFHIPFVNKNIERYEEDTYLELEEFDQALMELGIPKDADVEGYQNCDLDQVYVERFLRIINR